MKTLKKNIYSEQKAVALVSTTTDQLQGQGLCEIPQVDVSMHLPSYPGSEWPLFGCATSALDNRVGGSKCKPVVLLFRARNLEESRQIAGLLQPIELRLEELLPMFLLRRHHLEIVLEEKNQSSSATHLY